MTTRRLSRGAALLAAALLATACSGQDTGGDDPAPPPTSTATPDVPATAPELGGYLAAVARTAAASSLTFEASVRVRTSAGVVEILLEGERNGSDRVLVITTDQGSLTYVVAGGSATVDRGDGPQAVQLTEVPSAPSIEQLANLDGAVETEPGVVEGTIDAALILTAGDAPATGSVTATVRYDAGGFLTSLELRADDGSYAAAVTYRDVVA